MKPETQSQTVGPEQSIPKNEGINVESKPNIPKNEEALIDSGAERVEQVAEANAAIADINSSIALPSPVTDDDSSDNSKLTTSDVNPLIANDDDLVEKEWVDRAKKIVAETQNEPHKQKEEVSELKIDYMKKRFGRELGVAE